MVGGRGKGRALDVVGVLFLGAILAMIAPIIWRFTGHDLNVYHYAVAHLLTDDVYEFVYPEWPFLYPPSALLALTPSGLALPVARALMFACSVLAVVATVTVTVRSAARGTAVDRVGPVAMLSALSLLTWPFIFGSVLGQVAPVIVGLTAVGVLGRRSRWNGVWLGTAIAIKLTPAAFWLYWGSVRRWRALLVSVGTFLAWTLVAALIMPSSSRWYFWDGGMFQADVEYDSLSNQSITGIAARMGLDGPAGRAGALVVAGAGLLAAVFVARRLHRVGWSAAAVGLVGIWTGLVAPVAWTHAFGWWPQLAIAVWLCGRRSADVVVAGAVYFAPLLVLVGPLDSPNPSGLSQQLQGATYALIAVAVTVYLSWRVRSAGGPVPVPRDSVLAGPGPDRTPSST